MGKGGTNTNELHFVCVYNNEEWKFSAKNEK